MPRTIAIRGRIRSRTVVDLDEPLPENVEEVEVVARVPDEANQADLLQFLQRIPPGTRTKEEIDRQIEEERASWDS